MKVKVKMPGDYVRHIIMEPGKSDILAKPTFTIEPYTDDEVLMNDLVTQMPYGPEFYNYITKVLPRIAARNNEGLIFSGEVGERRPNRVSDRLADTFYGHPMYDYYGIDEENNPEGDRLMWIGEGTAAHPRNLPGFIHSIYKGWKDPDYRRYKDSAQKKSDILTNILNLSHDFTPLLGPKTPYRDPDYPWDKYPKGNVKVSDEDYNRKIRSRIHSLEQELKYPSSRLPRDPASIKDEIKFWKENYNKGFLPAPGDDIIPLTVKDVKTGEDKRIFIPTAHILNMPLYNWNSRLFDFYGDKPEQIWKMFENKDTKNDWSQWNKANQIAMYNGEIDPKYNVNSPYEYLVENAKLAGKGYFDKYLRSLDIKPNLPEEKTVEREVVKDGKKQTVTDKVRQDPIVKDVLKSEGYSSENHDPENFKKDAHKIVVTNVTQKPVYHNLGTDTAHLTDMQYEKPKALAAINPDEEKGISGKDRIRMKLREAKGEVSKEKLRDAKKEYAEKMAAEMTPEDKLKAKRTQYTQDVNARIVDTASGKREVQTQGNINQNIKEKVKGWIKQINKGVNSPDNVFINYDIEPSDENKDIIIKLARENWNDLADKYGSDYTSIWRDIANIYKWRKADFERHMAEKSDSNESIGNILKGVGEFGQI